MATLDKPALPFKKGFALMAAHSKVRVVPCTFLYGEDFLAGDRSMATSAARVKRIG